MANAAVAEAPRVTEDEAIRFDANGIGSDPEAFLAAREAKFDNIRQDLQKEIVWVDPTSKARTPMAIVYVHGFSASKGEVRPMPDLVAADLGANLFYTRLAGHGQDGAAMGGASVNDWINDMAEALAIGRTIGERVTVVASSTGGSLATWAAARPEFAGQIDAMVLISPNFRVLGTGAGLLAGPWGGQLAHLLIGPEQSIRTTNGLQSRFWTTTYPTAAIMPMAALVEMGRRSPVESISTPALFIFSDTDRVVDAKATRTVINRWGGPVRPIEVVDADDPNNHVIAGDAYSPSTTGRLAQAVTDWLRSVSP
jgi:pimeloyl-ACP methyl ester carboxylesterase